MTPRITPDDKPDAEIADVLAKSLSRNGKPLNILLTLARHPFLFKRYNALGGLFLRHGDVPPRERELVILRTGWRSRSEYEFGQHTIIGKAAGLSDDEISRLAQPSQSRWAPRDQALIRMVDELWDTDRISDSTWAMLAGQWDQRQLLELVMLQGFYRMTASFLNSIGVEREEGVPSWPQTH